MEFLKTITVAGFYCLFSGLCSMEPEKPCLGSQLRKNLSASDIPRAKNSGLERSMPTQRSASGYLELKELLTNLALLSDSDSEEDERNQGAYLPYNEGEK